MAWRAPRRTRRHAASAAVLAGLGIIGVVLVGCSSSGFPAASSPSVSAPATSVPTSPDPTSSDPTSSDPTRSGDAGSSAASSSAPPSLVLPQPTSTAVDRTIVKPASARRVAYPDCLAGIDTVARFVSGAVFGAATPFVRQSNFVGAGRLATAELRSLARARSAFIAAGYRSTFPTVRDLDAEIAAAKELVAIVKVNRIEQLPAVFLRLSSAGDQYVRDSPDSVCAA